MAKKPKKLILVVHGIGEQSAGETLDQLVGADVGNRQAQVESEVRWLRDSYGGANLRAAELFPCHIRRVTTEKSELAFSEVYWADLSRGGAGAIATAYELVKGILGLGHVVRENADSIYPGKHPLKQLSRLFVSALHGPIAVLNLLLAAGALLSYALHLALAEKQECWDPCKLTPLSENWAGGGVVFIGLLATWLGNRFRKKTGKVSDSYLFRIFGNWLFGLGLALVVLVAVTGLLDVLPWSQSVRDSLSMLFRVEPQFTGFNWYGFVLILTLNLVWFLTLVDVSLLLILQALFGKSTPSSDAPPLYTVICAIMVVLWMVVAATFWSAINKALPSAVINPELLRQGVKLLFVIWVMAGLIVFVAVRIWFKRQTWAESHTAKNYKNNPVPRLLIASSVRKIFIFAVLALTVTALFFIYVALSNGFEVWDWLANILEHGFSISFGLSALIGAAYMSQWKNVAEGLGIAKDVITYFKGEPDDGGKWAYPLRKRINGRFNTVIETMIAAEKPSEVIIVSHSQGTVIAIEAMCENLNSKLFATRGLTVRKLVTMGSPYSHIYEYFFPGKFKIPDELKGKFSVWLNIFRIDDFVGTVVGKDGGSWPQNKPVDSGGHTGYWTDDQVLNILNKQIIKP